MLLFKHRWRSVFNVTVASLICANNNRRNNVQAYKTFLTVKLYAYSTRNCFYKVFVASDSLIRINHMTAVGIFCQFIVVFS